MLAYPGVSGIKPNNVKAETVKVFNLWLLSKYEDDSEQSRPRIPGWDVMEDICFYDQHPLLTNDRDEFESTCEAGELCIELFIFAEAYDIPALREYSLKRLIHCFDPGWSRYDLDSWMVLANISHASIREDKRKCPTATSARRRSLPI